MTNEDKPKLYALCALEELQTRKAMSFRFRHPERGVHDITLVWDGRCAYAIEDTCPHGLTSLVNGDILEGEIICPAHGAAFDLASGKCVDGYTDDTRVYAVEIVAGTVHVLVPGEERV